MEIEVILELDEDIQTVAITCPDCGTTFHVELTDGQPLWVRCPWCNAQNFTDQGILVASAPDVTEH